MRILASDLPPLTQAGLETFSDAFVDYFFRSEEVSMVVGYAAAEAVVELDKLIKSHHGLQHFNLVVGMAAFDGIFRSQMEALTDLDGSLLDSGLGRVHVAKALPVHAKASTFCQGNIVSAAIVGSSNLSGLISGFRQFEIDVLLDNKPALENVHSLVQSITTKASVPLDQVASGLRVSENPNLVLEGVAGVEKVDPSTWASNLSKVSFQIPIKAEPKSHLNVFFGAGRKQNGHEIPRPWYEVELIVGVDITRQHGYPQAGTPQSIFAVVTDDGWTFGCQTQGQNSKNLRSVGDLRILGKWLKERLQNSGALRIGERVTEETLKKYGRTHLDFTRVEDSDTWYIDFSRPNEN